MRNFNITNIVQLQDNYLITELQCPIISSSIIRIYIDRLAYYPYIHLSGRCETYQTNAVND